MENFNPAGSRISYNFGRRGSNVNSWILNNSATHVGVLLGMKNVVSNLIKSQGEVDRQNCYGLTPLQLAVISDCPDIAEALLKSGSRYDVPDNEQQLPFHYAADKNNTVCLKLLFQAVGHTTKEPEAAIGCFLKKSDIDGVTPLHLASQNSNHKGLQSMLKYCSSEDVKCFDNDKLTPLHWAAASGKEENVRLLLKQHASGLSLDRKGRTPLHWACFTKDGNKACVKALLSDSSAALHVQDINGFTPLHLATIMRKVPSVETLLSDKRCNANVRDSFGRTALHWAAYSGNEELVKHLISSSAYINDGDSNGATPIHYAAKGNHEAVVEILAKHPSANESATKDGHTPLHYAAATGAKRALLKLLVYEFRLECKDHRGRTALHIATQNCQNAMVAVLLKLEASVDSVSQCGFTPFLSSVVVGGMELVRLFLNAKCDIFHTDTEGRGALHLAVLGRFLHLSQSLLQLGISVNGKDNYGRTPLHYAAIIGFTDVLALLLENRADVDVRDNEGHSALHCAASKANVNAVNILIEYHAYVNFMATTENRMTPLDFAKESKHHETLKVLLDYGGVSSSWILNAAAVRIQRRWRINRIIKRKTNVITFAASVPSTSTKSEVNPTAHSTPKFKVVRFGDERVLVPIGAEREKMKRDWLDICQSLKLEKIN